jgi:hypothetical protein
MIVYDHNAADDTDDAGVDADADTGPLTGSVA